MHDYSYKHSSNSLSSLKDALSEDRLTKYLDYASNDWEKALELHSWNCALGASLHIAIQHFELMLRNACARELQTIFGNDWFNSLPPGNKPAIFSRVWFQSLINRAKECFWCCVSNHRKRRQPEIHEYLREEIISVQLRLKQQKRNPNNGPCVVAALSFGFWVALFSKALDREFYNAGLYRAIPNQPPGKKQRQKFHAKLERLKTLRNRIAHHEPLFHRNLEQAHKLILETSGYINTDAANWIAYHSKFDEIWKNPPDLSKDDLERLRKRQNDDTYFLV